MWGVLSVLVVIVTCLYLLFCVDPNSTSAIGRLRRFFFHKFPVVLEYALLSYHNMSPIGITED